MTRRREDGGGGDLDHVDLGDGAEELVHAKGGRADDAVLDVDEAHNNVENVV